MILTENIQICIRLLPIFDCDFLSYCQLLIYGIVIHYVQHFQAMEYVSLLTLSFSVFCFEISLGLLNLRRLIPGPRIMKDLGLEFNQILINPLFAINGQLKFHMNEMVGKTFQANIKSLYVFNILKFQPINKF